MSIKTSLFSLSYQNRCLNWTLTPFGPCSVTCGSGTRSRNATCPKENRCHEKDLPPLEEACTEQPCVHWVQGPWSMCTKSCDGGYQIRFVKCVNAQTQEASQQCQGERPAHKRECNTHKCQKSNQSEYKFCFFFNILFFTKKSTKNKKF